MHCCLYAWQGSISCLWKVGWFNRDNHSMLICELHQWLLALHTGHEQSITRQSSSTKTYLYQPIVVNPTLLKQHLYWRALCLWSRRFTKRGSTGPSNILSNYLLVRSPCRWWPNSHRLHQSRSFTRRLRHCCGHRRRWVGSCRLPEVCARPFQNRPRRAATDRLFEVFRRCRKRCLRHHPHTVLLTLRLWHSLLPWCIHLWGRWSHCLWVCSWTIKNKKTCMLFEIYCNSALHCLFWCWLRQQNAQLHEHDISLIEHFETCLTCELIDIFTHHRQVSRFLCCEWHVSASCNWTDLSCFWNYYESTNLQPPPSPSPPKMHTYHFFSSVVVHIQSRPPFPNTTTVSSGDLYVSWVIPTESLVIEGQKGEGGGGGGAGVAIDRRVWQQQALALVETSTTSQNYDAFLWHLPISFSDKISQTLEPFPSS